MPGTRYALHICVIACSLQHQAGAPSLPTFDRWGNRGSCTSGRGVCSELFSLWVQLLFPKSPHPLTQTCMSRRQRGMEGECVCVSLHIHAGVGELGAQQDPTLALCHFISSTPYASTAWDRVFPHFRMSKLRLKMGGDSKLGSRLVLGSRFPALSSTRASARFAPFYSPWELLLRGPPCPWKLDPRKCLLAPPRSPSPSPTGSREAFTGKIIRNLILISPTLLIVCGQFDCNSRH